MDLALIAAAGLMGLLGAPHCTAMCGAPCAAVAQRCGASGVRRGLPTLLLGRLLGYMAGGAAVAAGVALFSGAAAWAPALRPLWAAVHVATLGLAGWMLLTGRMPDALGRLGRAAALPSAAGWQPVRGPRFGPADGHGALLSLADGSRSPRSLAAGALGAGALGTLWVAMPCGLLQSALIVAALADTPAQGAAAMGAFALASSLGLVALPALVAAGLPGFSGERATRGVVRLSGLLLLVGSGWALGHGLWQRVAALCLAA